MNETVLQLANLAKWGSLAIATPFVARWGYLAARQIYDDVYRRLVERQHDRLTLEHIGDQNKLHQVRAITPNEQGRFPLLQGIDGTIRDPNTLRAFTLRAVLERFPELESVEPRIRALEAAHGWPTPAAAEAMLPEGAPVSLATGQTLGDLLKRHNFTPRLHSILIGEYVDGDQVKPLALDLPKSVHVLNTGASGLGKSTLLEAMAIQLAGLVGVEMTAIDYGSGTFDKLEPAMKWKIADDPALAIALLAELIKLCNERKTMYKRVGRVRSLDQYNVVTGDNLPFVVAMVDETSALLDYAGTKAPFIELARMGRKYGVGLVLGGTDFKATTLPSEARSNCQARIAFWLERGLSMSLLGNNDAFDIDGAIGQIVVKKPGIKGTIHGQTPNVTEADYAGLALDGDPADLTPVETVDITRSGGLTGDQVNEIMDMHYEGAKPTPIAQAVFGYNSSFYITKVRRVINEYDNVTGDNSENDQEKTE